jgi:tRNA(Ser,Leu) C12 N-acetylase TAN1
VFERHGLGDWNVVVTVRGDFATACRLLGDYGHARRTPFYNVVVMSVPDGRQLLEALQARTKHEPLVEGTLARVLPIERAFHFSTSEEFERKAAAILEPWAAELAGKRFHVRLHRRGMKGRLSTQIEEHALDRVLIDALARSGATATIAFDDPDEIVTVETLSNHAGLARYSRDDLRRFPLLHLD